MERGVERMRGLGLDFTNTVSTGGMLDMCLCLGCVCREWVGAWRRFWRGGVGFCILEKYVGIRGNTLKQIKSYFSNRTQCVQIDNVCLTLLIL